MCSPASGVRCPALAEAIYQAGVAQRVFICRLAAVIVASRLRFGRLAVNCSHDFAGPSCLEV